MPVDITDKCIRIIVRNPDLFVDNSFRTIELSAEQGIKSIIGKLKTEPTGSTKIQAYLFNKQKWDTERAQRWVDEHGKDAGWLFGENTAIEFNEEENKEMKSEIMKKMYDCEVKGFDDTKLSFTAIASTEEKDRDGDILRATGWKLKNYRKNPVILWGHKADMLPIGRAENIRIEEDKLVFDPVFTPADINPLGEQVYKMYKLKFLNAFSVRFDPMSWEDMTADESGKGNQNERIGRDYKQQELLEISPVTIPSNASALINRDYQNFILKGFLYENSNIITDTNEREKLLKGETENKEPEITVKPEPELKPAENKENAVEIEKAGRVLSEKTRTLISGCIEDMQASIDALNELLTTAEPPKELEIDEIVNSLKSELQGKSTDIYGEISSTIQQGITLIENIKE